MKWYEVILKHWFFIYGRCCNRKSPEIYIKRLTQQDFVLIDYFCCKYPHHIKCHSCALEGILWFYSVIYMKYLVTVMDLSGTLTSLVEVMKSMPKNTYYEKHSPSFQNWNISEGPIWGFKLVDNRRIDYCSLLVMYILTSMWHLVCEWWECIS